MNRIDRSRALGTDRQTGTTLIVALVLILLASLLALFAMNVGIFAQRTSAADVRARVVHETLEAALAQGIEYVKNNRTIINPSNTALWTLCTAADTSFPCGAVPQCAGPIPPATSATDSTGGSSNGSTTCTGGLVRRANMFYYSGGAGYNVDGSGTGNLTSNQLNKNSLPLGTSVITSTGNGFSVNYGVGVLLCSAKTPAATTDPVECTAATGAGASSGTYIFTLVAVGNISGESATTTLSTAFGTAPVAGGGGNLPPLVASGTADLTGNGTFVTNANAGGNGVPVTVWTRGCTNKTGTPNTCYEEDWLRTANGINAGSTLTFANNSNGSPSTVPVCSGNGNKSCSCSTSLSYLSPGNAQAAGIDILSNDSAAGCTDPPVNGTTACTSTSTCKSNYDVQPPEFPCDLFDFVFHVQAWQDLTGTAVTACTAKGMVDCFCETRMPKVNQAVGDGTSPLMNVDEAYLYSKAVYIYSTAHPTWPTAAQAVTSCTQLISSASASGGLVWDQTGTCLKNGGQIGYPDKPVILVSDGTADNNGATVFGLVFVRDISDPTTVVGGAATMTTHATGTIYGAVVVMGPAAKLNGSSAIVSIPSVLAGLSVLSTANPPAPLPASWTDRYSYY